MRDAIRCGWARTMGNQADAGCSRTAVQIFSITVEASPLRLVTVCIPDLGGLLDETQDTVKLVQDARRTNGGSS